MLFGFDARLRQLSYAQRQNLFTAGQKRLVFLVLTGVVFVPFAFWALAGVLATVNPEDPTSAFGVGGLLITWGPMLLFGLFSWLGYRAIRAKQRLLEAACVARPPLAVGEPSSCHVCGAPLTTPRGHSVARCSFCQADNLVDPAVLARAGRDAASAAGQIEETVAANAQRVAREAGVATAMLIPITLASPVIVIVSIFVFGVPLSLIEVLEDPQIRYALVPAQSGARCLARLRSKYGKPIIDLGPNGPAGMSERGPPPEGVPMTPLDLNQVAAMTVRSKEGEPARVVRRFQSLVFANDNQVEIEPVGGGAHEKREVRGTCLVEEAGSRQ